MRKSVAATVIAASTIIGACGQAQGGSGPTVSRTYQVGSFQQIEVAGSYDVTVHTGANLSVSAQGPQKLLDQTIVQVQGDKLVIYPQEHRGFSLFGSGIHNSAKFTVTVPQLNGAAIAGSGDVHVDQVRGAAFEGTVAGSGGLDVGTADVQSLKLSISGSGSTKIRGGKAQSADYAIAGSGEIEAGAIQTQQTKVSIEGSGSVKANATGTADVNIMGSGDVDISGGAKCTVSKAGSGSVRCS